MENFLRRGHMAFMDENTDLTSFDVHLVIGNEAADLDSVIASIAFGYMLHRRKNKNPNSIVVPVTVCSREDLPLRTEVTHWLRKHTISPNWLTHQEDVTRWWTRVKGENFHSFSVTLIDHNMPIGDMEFVTQYIVRIVDHHTLMPEMQDTINAVADEGELYWELVGSCCTLVAQRYFEGVKGEFDITAEEELLVLALLYGVILLDTLCLSPEFERFRPLDVEMLSRIEAELELSEASRAHIYHELEAAKFDVTGLTNLELLRRDVKFVRPFLAICAVCGLDYTDFIHRANIVQDILSYCHTEAVGIAVILTLGKGSPSDTELRRGIIVTRSSDHECPASLELINHLRSDANLALESFPSPNQRLVVFRQNNAKLSRKYILPEMARFLRVSRDSCTSGIPTPPVNTPQVNSDSEVAPEASNRDLPSFNNLATVQKVQAKRSNLNAESINSRSSASEPFTPANSLTKEGFLARLMHRGQDRGREEGFTAAQLSEEEAKRVANSVVLSAMKGGVRRTVRSALEEDQNSLSESFNEPSKASRDSLKMRFTHTSSLDGNGPVELAEIGTKPKPFTDAYMPRRHRNSCEVNIREKTIVSKEKSKPTSFDSIREGTFESHLDSEPKSVSQKPILYIDDGYDDRSRSRRSTDQSARSDDTLDIAASVKCNFMKPKAGRRNDSEVMTSCDTIDSLASSFIPEFLSSTDQTSDSSTLEEFSFVLDGKRENYFLRAIKNYENALQILEDTYLYEGNPCKIVLFFACLLPRNSEDEYENVMHTIYLHVMKSMQEMKVQDYILVYVNSGCRNDQTPNFNWLKECFLTLDNSLRKNVKKLFVVSPTFWTKALVFFFSVFISKKFFENIEYITTVPELTELLPQTRSAYFPHNCFEYCQMNQANDEYSENYSLTMNTVTLDTNDSID